MAGQPRSFEADYFVIALRGCLPNSPGGEFGAKLFPIYYHKWMINTIPECPNGRVGFTALKKNWNLWFLQ